MEALKKFRSRYERRAPAQNRITHTDQLILLTAEEGLRLLGPAPVKGVIPGFPPRGKGQGTSPYLWVFNDDGIPYIQEYALAAKRLYDGVAKHTNLTGGGFAYCGGELWFEADVTERIWLSGGSGRYGPRSSEELEDAVKVFEELGYRVTSLGWDEEERRASRVLR